MKCGKLTCLVFVVVVLVLAFMVLPVATGDAQTKSSEATLDIGLLFGLTGFISSRDLPDYNETLIAADVLNERGGITVKGQKYKFRMVAEDTKSTMDGVASAANRLAFDKKVKFVIGPLDFFAPAANQVLNPAKVLRVLHWSGISPGEVDSSTPYTFLGGNATVANALTVVKYLKKAYPNVKKIAFVTPDDGSVPTSSRLSRGCWSPTVLPSWETLSRSPMRRRIIAPFPPRSMLSRRRMLRPSLTAIYPRYAAS